MAQFPNLRWPRWSAVVDAWNDLGVPSVQVVEFLIGEQYPSLPWLDRKTNHQYIGSSSPQNDTAYHVAVTLPGRPEELLIAYRLYAFCRQHELDDFSVGVLLPAFERFDFALYSWWNANAKYVLPPTGFRTTARWRGDARTQLRNWPTLVQEAGETWRNIAESWAIIRIPDFMDHRSPEYQRFREYVTAEHERRERAEYERLKAKFAETTDGGESHRER